MDVGPDREARVRVAEPHLDLLDVLAGGEQQRRAGVPEGMEADPRYLCAKRRRVQDVAPEVGAVELLAGQGGEGQRAGDPSSARSCAAMPGDSGIVRSPAFDLGLVGRPLRSWRLTRSRGGSPRSRSVCHRTSMASEIRGGRLPPMPNSKLTLFGAENVRSMAALR